MTDDDARDAARYRWIRDNPSLVFFLSRDDESKAIYRTATEYIDDNPEQFQFDDPEEIERMRDTNTIWTVFVHPRTPVGSLDWHASTLDAVIDRAMNSSMEGR